MGAAREVGEMALDFEGLEIGYRLPPSSFVLDAATVLKYLEAVGGKKELYQNARGTLIPPLALLALGMKSLMSMLSLPQGMVHASQECHFLKPLPWGSRVTCQAVVSQKQARGPMRLLSLDVEVLAQDNEPVLKGKTTMVLPRPAP